MILNVLHPSLRDMASLELDLLSDALVGGKGDAISGQLPGIFYHISSHNTILAKVSVIFGRVSTKIAGQLPGEYAVGETHSVPTSTS